MTMTRWYALAGLLAATCLGLGTFGCDSADESGSGGQGNSTSSGTAGSGGQGAAGGQGGVGGQGGGVLTVGELCALSCPASVACGESGAPGQWPPSEADCKVGCAEQLATCTTDELETLLGCLSPHLDPDCDLAAVQACAGAAAACMTAGSGGAGGA